MSTSSAVDLTRVSQVVGYSLETGVFSPTSPNLPQRIALFGESNIANQSGLSTNARQITTAKEAGDLYGFGSPLHMMARILLPPNGGGVGGIPVIVYPQLEDGGATRTIIDVGVTGTATGNATHSLVINGRRSIDGQSYSYDVVDGDSAAQIITKMEDAVNSVLGTSVIATNPVTDLILTSKWAGFSSAEINITFDTGIDAVGITYSIANTVLGTTVPSITGSLALFGNEWNTIVVNSYGVSEFAELEAFNGVPSNTTPTGRYVGTIFKPFVALWGSILSNKTTLTAITDLAARVDQVTNVLCPAPNSLALTFEAAANGTVLFANTMQATPHLDVIDQSYPDMPIPEDGDIGDFGIYDNRDFMVKRGASTVVLNNGAFQFKDFITTYHPAGEDPPQFRFARNLVGVDWNVRFGYFLLEEINVVGKAIVENDQPTNVSGVVKPKQWAQIVSTYADDLGLRALIVDTTFMKDSITVATDGTNPDRFNTTFNYKRSPVARISATVGTAGFSNSIS